MALLTRRRKSPVMPDLAAFEAVTAALPLLAADGVQPSGVGAVCIKPPDKRFADLDTLVDQIASAGRYDAATDDYGHRWLTRRTSSADIDQVVADLAAVNRAVAGASLGGALLCTLVGFTAGSAPLALVYRARRGSWYPFVPAGEQIRDNVKELALRDLLQGTLEIEPDLTKWSPLWGSPVLDH
jgi:hypothetical protein